jgi:hypothetical protein
LNADENVEIALARSAAPASISDAAEVMVLGRDGYATAVKGSNGFVCIVERSWAKPTDDPEFWNSKIRAPNCFNPAASRTFLPIFLRKTELVLACSVEEGDDEDEVIGVLFCIDPADKRRLDRAAGLHQGYEERCVAVTTAGGPALARVYIADQSAISDALLPYTWYKNIVLTGAREHGLPDAYIRSMEAVPACQDPDPEREMKDRATCPG